MSFFPRDLAGPAGPSGPVIEWEDAACALCGNRSGTPLVEAPDSTPGGSGLWFAVVQCQDCGLCYTNPRPNPRTIGQFYPSVYGPHRPPRRRTPRPARWRPGWTRSCKERQTLPVQGAGRLLDFGCGSGSYLTRMHQQGWQVTGVDVSQAAVRHIRTELGLPALVGSLPHPELRHATFDVITMWHSLEHVHAPVAVLREAHRLLTPGGKLLVAVPNIDSLPFRWFGSAWYGLDLPRHLTHFAPWTLQHMLERVGFRVGPIRMVRHSDWLRSSAKLAGRLPRGPHWHRWLTTKFTSRLATWYSYLTKQSDCMLVAAER
jgi:SAM-dependent methyltransferase